MKQDIWQNILANAITDISELCAILHIDPTDLPISEAASQDFALRVPRDFVARMKEGDVKDPLLLQILPTKQEMEVVQGFSKDPLHESKANPAPGLLHKYHGRVLLTLAGSCAINCRYCFRRYFPYADNLSHKNWRAALEYIEKNKTISEIILSGGEPLIVKDKQLTGLINHLAEIKHVKRLRIHTRFPIVIPERITNNLIKSLTATRLQSVIVLHCNHANEINDSVVKSLTLLREAKIPLLNQAVLLKNINDDIESLLNLSERLFVAGVMPYYLHLLDPVQGSAHFMVNEDSARWLIIELMRLLPGYLVPKLVREVVGEPFKLPVHAYC